MKDGRIEKIDINAKKTEIQLLNSVTKLDRVQDKNEEDNIFSPNLEKTEVKEAITKEAKQKEKNENN